MKKKKKRGGGGGGGGELNFCRTYTLQGAEVESVKRFWGEIDCWEFSVKQGLITFPEKICWVLTIFFCKKVLVNP